jgi:hypothetical protein
LLGKRFIKPKECRQALGITTDVMVRADDTTAAIIGDSGVEEFEDSDDVAIHNDGNDSNGSDDDDDDDDDDTVVFTPAITFNQLIDYDASPELEALTNKLLGTTVQTDMRARSSIEFVQELVKLSVLMSAPTFCVDAVYGLMESVIVKIPSSNLSDSKTGLNMTIHDLPGLVATDTARAECFIEALTDGLKYENPVVLHVMSNAETATEIIKGLADAGVFKKLLDDPKSIKLIPVYPTDYHEYIEEEDLKLLGFSQQKMYCNELSIVADKLQGCSDLDIDDDRIQAAIDTITLVTVETKPNKVAKLRGDTTKAHSDVSALKEALTAYSTSCWESTLLSVLHDAATTTALRAYMCYQSKAIFQSEQERGSSSSRTRRVGSSGSSSFKGNNIEFTGPVQQILKQKIAQLKRVSDAFKYM